MSQLLEIVWLKSAAYTADPQAIDAIIKANFVNLNGVVASYKGSNIEVPDEHVFINVWSTTDYFNTTLAKFTTNAAEALKDHIDAPPRVTSISLDGTGYAEVFASPVVSFSYVTPKEGLFEETISHVVEKLYASRKSTNGFIHGEVNEEPGTVLNIMGRDIAEDDDIMAMATEAIHAVFNQLREKISEHEVKDVKLTMFDV